jgi:hypothetical protein
MHEQLSTQYPEAGYSTYTERHPLAHPLTSGNIPKAKSKFLTRRIKGGMYKRRLS